MENVLEFNNTVSWDSDGLTQERLTSPQALRDWMAKAKLISKKIDIGSKELREAIAFRALLHRILLAVSEGGKPSAADRAEFDDHLARAMRAGRITPSLEWDFSARTSRELLAPLVWETAQLLTSPESLRVLHACANPECGWFFLDHSRKHNRRWCDMNECGSRAKARAYYERKKRATSKSARGKDRASHRR